MLDSLLDHILSFQKYLKSLDISNFSNAKLIYS